MSVPFPDSLCHRCAAVRQITSARGATYLMCTARAPKYPAQPVRSCSAHQPRDPGDAASPPPPGTKAAP